MSRAVVTSAVEGWIASCRIERPEARNALGRELMEELAGELERLDADEAVRVIVIAGSDEVFATGADAASLSEPSLAAAAGPATAFWRRLDRIEKPTIAAVSGWALGGGCELALACDMCVAAERTQFGLPEVTLGMIPGGGGTQRLARVLGKQLAMELVLTGRRFSAEQALRWGLVNHIGKRRSWLREATEFAAEVAARAPLATRLAKQAVLAAEREPIEAALETERELYGRALATEDRAEGVEAFVQGRPPRFRGR